MKKVVENRIWQHRIRSLLVLAAMGLAVGACGSSGKGGHESSTPPDSNVTPPADDENVGPVPDENPVVPGEFDPEGPDVACSNCANDDAPDLVCTDCGEQFCGDGDTRGGSSPLDLAAFWAMIRYEKDHGYGPVLRTQTLSSEVIDKAPKDECWYGLGDSEPMQAVIGRDEVCGEGDNMGTPKANYAYIWGLTGTQGYIYAASLANTVCLVAQGYFNANTPIVTPDMVCEDGENPPFGDWRPSQLMRIAPTPPYEETDLAAGMPLDAVQLLYHTTGIRSAGSNDDVVFFAGPGFGTGVNMFAFEAASGAFLGAQSFPEYNDIRRWARVGDDLYTAVGVADDEYDGAVLRWRGCVPEGDDLQADCCDLFDFEVVGHLDAAGAELVEHEGRLAAGTWGGDAGIWLSPPLGEDGLDASAADEWTKVFKISDYDPDPITVATTGMGAMASYQGKLFFGTMHVPLFATYVALSTGADRYDRDGDGLETDELLATYLGTHRSTAFFMGEDLGGDCPRIRLVYGERYLPIYDPAQKSYTIGYDCAHQNRLGQIPLQGPSGFGNYFNDYGWAAKLHGDALYYGMFDSSSVAKLLLRTLAAEQKVDLPEEQITALFEQFRDKLPTVGADLFRIVDGGGRAFAEVFDGFGNWTNYGVRNLLDLDGTLYAGTANPFNLNPNGGWELVKFYDNAEPSELHATFTPGPNGNDWWVETYVEADKLLTGVDARVNGGEWRSLELKPWKTFADNIHAVYGSVVEFRATAEDGSVAISPRFIWPTAEIAPDDMPFEACFQHVRGNSWWVETSVYANGPVDDVYARASGGDWMHLCPTDYDAYAASFYVPGGAPVEFKACPMSGGCLTSPAYPWPDSCSAENPE